MSEGIRIKLDVQLFGGLVVSYEGKNISVGKNKSAKYVQLLEIVWLAGENGIPKDVEITSHMYWLNLNDSPEKWARIIDYNMIESKERVIDVNTRDVQSVNVVHTAKTLQDKYLELVDED